MIWLFWGKKNTRLRNPNIRVQIYFEEAVRNLCAYLEVLSQKVHQSRLSSDLVNASLQFRE